MLELGADLCRPLVASTQDLSILDSNQNSCMLLACQAGNNTMIPALIEAKQDLNASVPCELLPGRRSKSGARPPLLVAAATRKGLLRTIQTLLDNGADPQTEDTFRMDLIHYASWEGNENILNYMLSADIGIDLESKGCDYSVGGSCTLITTVLHSAAARGSPLSLKRLLDEIGAPAVNACAASGETPLHLAAA